LATPENFVLLTVILLIMLVYNKDLDRMWCIESEYPAEDIYDLGEHMYEYHAEENSDYAITCYFCGNDFRTKGDLMVHMKKGHAEKLRLC
jgi:hypothetical protein